MSAKLPVKVFKSHREQIDLLRARGMIIDDEEQACHILKNINYYRLSGYWYSLRQLPAGASQRSDNFIDGSTFEHVIALYDFDERLRACVFQTLTIIELALRSILGYELGCLDPHAHLHPELLGPVASQRESGCAPSPEYSKWLARYRKELSASREDFVTHHKRKYGGQLPVWAAVEIMDFGSVNYLYRFSPGEVRQAIAARVSLTPAQLGSWIKSLNIVRNYSAHHARMFNRVYTLQPRLPGPGQVADLDATRSVMNRCFGQLTLIQYLLAALDLGDTQRLPRLMSSYPDSVPAVPISHVGAPPNWQELSLWHIS